MLIDEFYSKLIERLHFIIEINNQIQIYLDKGIVILEGKVSSYFEKKLIGKAIKNLVEENLFCDRIGIVEGKKFRLSDESIALLEINAI